MPEIEIHLTELFSGETVIVSAGGLEVFRGEGIRTEFTTSLARIVKAQVPDGEQTVRVEVPEHRASAEARIDPSGLRFLVVSLPERRLRIEAVSEEDYRREPRGYA